MKIWMIILVGVFAMMVVHHNTETSAFRANPIEIDELKFNNSMSQPLYVGCVMRGNQRLKVLLQTNRLPKDAYADSLKRLKARCRCVVTKPKLLEAKSVLAKGLFSLEQYQAVYTYYQQRCQQSRPTG